MQCRSTTTRGRTVRTAVQAVAAARSRCHPRAMAYELKSFRRQTDGSLVPEASGGFGDVDQAREAGKRALARREDLHYSQVVDENSGAVVAVVKR